MAAGTQYMNANAYSLVDHYLNSNDPDVKNTALVMIEESSMWTDVPMTVDPTFKMNGTRITGNLNAPSWVPLGTPPALVAEPDPEWFSEGIFIHRDGIQVDDLELRERNTITDPFELRIRTKLKGFSYDFDDALINNCAVTYTNRRRAANPNCFIGLRERIDNPATYGTYPDLKIDAGGVNLSSTGAASDGWNMEYLLDKLLSNLGASDGTGITIAANNQWIRAFARAVKRSGSGGGFRYDKDALDRTIPYFRNAKIIDGGRLAPTGNRANRVQNPIISYTETADGSQDTGGNFTSVYAYRTGADALHGWQFDAFKPSDPFLLPDGTTWQVNINGTAGLFITDGRSIGRIYDILMDANP